MTKTIFLSSALLAIALNPLMASAQPDAQYPASNFEPKVIFSADATDKDSKPANNESTQAHAQKAEFDPQHPAAFFEPKVIFP